MALLDLDLRPGLAFQHSVWDGFGLPINFYEDLGTKEFLLVVSVGRCSLRVNEDSVGFFLQAAIGGLHADFRLLQLNDQVFQFSVSSKQIGFQIYKLRSYECSQFKIYFHLWGNGGPAWKIEATKFLQEEDSSWILVQNRKKRDNRSYADVVRSSVLTGANRVPLAKQSRNQQYSVLNRLTWSRKSVFYRLQFKNRAKNMGFGGQTVVQNSNWSPQAGINNGPNPLVCSKCLQKGHHVSRCRQPIKCRICLRSGHISIYCKNYGKEKLVYIPKSDASSKKGIDVSHWFRQPLPMTYGSSSSGPPVFNTFRDFFSRRSLEM